MSHEHNGEFCLACLLEALANMIDDASHRLLKGFWMVLPTGTMINLRHAEMIDLDENDVVISMSGGSDTRIPTDDPQTAAAIVRGIQSALGLQPREAIPVMDPEAHDAPPPEQN